MKKSVFSLKIIAIIVATLAGILSASAQTAEFIDALFLLQKGETGQARELLEKEISLNPDNDAAYFYLASAILAEDFQDKRVEEYLKKASQLDPDNYWYIYDLAIHYAENDDLELAAAKFEELADKFPRKSGIHYDLANAYASLGDIDKAIEALNNIERLRGKSEALILSKLQLLSSKPDADIDSLYGSLIEYYEDYKTPRLAEMIGDYYLQTYRDSLAYAMYEQATDMDPDYTPAYFSKARINRIRRQWDSYFENISYFINDPYVEIRGKIEVISELLESPQFFRSFSNDMDRMAEDLERTHPGDTLAYAFLSTYYYNTDRVDRAIELQRLNTENYPESLGNEMQYLILLYYCQDWDLLSDAATEGLLRFPGNIDLLQLRGIAFSQMDKVQEAIEDHSAILRQNPKDSSVVISTYSSLGDLYFKAGNPKMAYKNYEKALKLNPSYTAVLNNYAYYLALEGKKLKKAREMSNRTIEQEPDNPTYLDTYAWILHLLGQDVEAKAIFKHAMLYGGKESKEILTHYAEVLDALGEHDLADIYRNQAKVMTE